MRSVSQDAQARVFFAHTRRVTDQSQDTVGGTSGIRPINTNTELRESQTACAEKFREREPRLAGRPDLI